MGAKWIERLRDNAMEGRGACLGCPAFEDGRSRRMNPELFDPAGEVMFVTIEPNHRFDWDEYADWEEYNEEITRKFLAEWTGGPVLESLLGPIPDLEMGSVWMTDAIKCPPEAGDDDQVRDEAFAHCRTYLQREITQVAPDVVVALGKHASLRTLSALGVDLDHVSPARECGRIVDADPPVIISPHWSYGWLGRETSDAWGRGWRSTHDHLDSAYSSNASAVRDSIRAVRRRSSG